MSDENVGGSQRSPRPDVYHHSCKGLIGRVPVVLHPSLYRAVKLTDGTITNEMATGYLIRALNPCKCS